MSIGKLVTFFASFTKLPVYVEDVRDQIVALGIQDQIEFQPVDEDPQKFRGMFFRYRTRPSLYADHENHTVIFYNQNVSPNEQNFICCKELMHVFDEMFKACVSSAKELEALLSALFQTDSNPEDVTVSGVLDIIAEFAALAIMFPDAARETFPIAVKDGRMTSQEVAEALGIPWWDTAKLLSEQWEPFVSVLKNL
jgi:hypothetical protein